MRRPLLALRVMGVVLLSLSLHRCGSLTPAWGGTPVEAGYMDRLSALSAKEWGEDDKGSGSDMRMKSVAQAAFALGARGGLAMETDRIDKSLDDHQNILDRIFDFRGLALADGRIAPPIIAASHDATTLASPVELQRVSVSWHIVHPATLLTSMPDWRMYLIRHFSPPDTRKIPHLLLPKNPEEKKVWRANVKKGFAKGVRQAKMSFLLSLRRLKADYVGMIRFHALAVRHILTIPVYAHTDLGTLHRSGDRVDVGVRIYRISLPTTFSSESIWKDRAVLAPEKKMEDPR